MFESPIIYIEELDSTSSYLRNIDTDTLSDGTTVYTGFQTAGRGQRGNSWESEKGENLTFSTVLFPKNIKPEDQFLISQITSLAIRDVLSEYTDHITIKWPNDIYWKDKKITGMLIENDIMGYNITQSILGIGININQTKFKSNAPNPVSLKQITGINYDIAAILKKILQNLYDYYTELNTPINREEIKTRYKKSLYRREGFYNFADKDGTFSACIADIEETGILVLKTKWGDIRKYGFKEIKYLFD